MAELAALLAEAAMDPVCDDDPAADAGAEKKSDEVADSATGAQDVLGQRGDVAVVVHEHGTAEGVLDMVFHADTVPAREIGGVNDDASIRVERPRGSDAHGEHVLQLEPGVPDRLACDVDDPVEHRFRTVLCRGQLEHAMTDAARRVHHRARDLGPAEVDAHYAVVHEHASWKGPATVAVFPGTECIQSHPGGPVFSRGLNSEWGRQGRYCRQSAGGLGVLRLRATTAVRRERQKRHQQRRDEPGPNVHCSPCFIGARERPTLTENYQKYQRMKSCSVFPGYP